MYGGKAGEIGSYWTKTKPSGPLQSVIDSALDQNWGNNATKVVQMKIPKGVEIFEGNRVYGGSSGKVGSYMTRVPQNGGMQSQIDLALNPQWGNTAQYVTKVTVPKGTVIYEGTAAPQVINGGAGQLIGGGNQVYIPEANASWFK